MLILQNLEIIMKKDLRTLVSGLSMTLNEGDRCAVIGEEGNGKSTLLKLIYNPALVADYVEYTGSINRDDLIMSYLAQELSRAEKEMTAYEFCCNEPGFLESSPGELAQMAGRLNIPQELFYGDMSLGKLSGGEKVKLRMAMLLLKRPDILLLDEPSGDLDIDALEWMESFLIQTKVPVLYISHDETLLENTANMVLHMEQLRRKTLARHTVAREEYKNYMQSRSLGMQHQEQVARKEREDAQKQQERYRQLYQKVNHGLNTNSRQDPHAGKMLKRKMKAVKSMGRRFEREAEDFTDFPDSEEAILVDFPAEATVPAGKVVLDFSLDELRAGERLLAKDIRLFVKGPEHICIVGKNGTGKTSLLRLISQELADRIDLKAAYMPQDYEEQMDISLTPVDYLTDSSGEISLQSRAKTYLGSMKYTADECSHKISQLSGGQKAKLFFLKMILDGSNVLLLDEPTRNFSPLSNPVIRNILRNFGGCIISVSHDRKYISQVCDKIYVLDEQGLQVK